MQCKWHCFYFEGDLFMCPRTRDGPHYGQCCRLGDWSESVLFCSFCLETPPPKEPRAAVSASRLKINRAKPPRIWPAVWSTMAEHFKTGSLLDLYSSLKEENFPHMRKDAQKMLVLFGSTYMRTNTLVMKFNRSDPLSDTCQLSHLHLIQPNFMLLFKQHRLDYSQSKNNWTGKHQKHVLLLFKVNKLLVFNIHI